MKFVGIDTGVTGAIALLDSDADPIVIDMPRTVDGVDGQLLYHQLKAWAPAEVYVERTHAMPKNGSMAAFSLGDSRGAVRTAVTAARVPLIWVSPRDWQQAHGLYGGGYSDKARKDRSRWKAQELFPTLADSLGRAKDHNRAEALLIAEYGRRTSITAAVVNG